MKKTEARINQARRNELENVGNYSSSIGITKSLLEKYKPSNQIRILEGRNNVAKNKIAA